MQKKLSIISVTFNDVDGLKKTMASIKCQSFQDFEWIVVDGGTKDNRIPLLLKDERVNKYVSEMDDGIYDAMLKGANLASGTHLLFLNSGDRLSSQESTRVIFDCLLEQGVQYYSANFVSANGSVLFKRKSFYPSLYIYHSVPGNQQATIYLRSDVLRCGFGDGYKICGDYYLAACLHRSGVVAYAKDTVVSDFELGGVSSRREDLLCEEAENIQKNILNMGYIFRSFSKIIRKRNISRASEINKLV